MACSRSPPFRRPGPRESVAECLQPEPRMPMETAKHRRSALWPIGRNRERAASICASAGCVCPAGPPGQHFCGNAPGREQTLGAPGAAVTARGETLFSPCCRRHARKPGYLSPRNALRTSRFCRQRAPRRAHAGVTWPLARILPFELCILCDALDRKRQRVRCGGPVPHGASSLLQDDRMKREREK